MPNKKQDSAKQTSLVTAIAKSSLGFFIAFLLIFLISPPTGFLNVPAWQQNALAVAAAMLLGTICGAFYYFQDTKWGPAKRKKVLLKPPFTELFQHGFTRYGDVAVGDVHGYVTLISYKWTGGKSVIKMDILFGLGFHVHNSRDVLSDIRHRNPPRNRFSSLAHEWTQNSIGCNFEYMFSPPSYEKIMAKAEELSSILLREHLVPIGLDNISQAEKEG